MKSKYLMAPMHGYTNYFLRKFMSNMGADYVFSEMLHVESVKHNQKLLERNFPLNEENIIIQLAGENPLPFINSIKHINETVDYVGINLNAGCPSSVINKTGAGYELLKRKEVMLEILKNIKRYSNGTTSVKIRILDDRKKTIEIIKELKDYVDFIIIHPRTKEQGYSGELDYEFVKIVRETVDLPIVLSGNLNEFNSRKLKVLTGADSLMYGRNALQNPNIFRIMKGLEPSRAPINRYIEEYKRFGKPEGLSYLKMHLIEMLKGRVKSKETKARISRAKSDEEVLGIMQEIL